MNNYYCTPKLRAIVRTDAQTRSTHDLTKLSNVKFILLSIISTSIPRPLVYLPLPTHFPFIFLTTVGLITEVGEN